MMIDVLAVLASVAVIATNVSATTTSSKLIEYRKNRVKKNRNC